MTPLQMLKLISSILDLLEAFNVQWQKFAEIRDRAKAENREISDAELQSVIDDANEAVQRL